MAASFWRRGKSGLHENTAPANGRAGRPDGKCCRDLNRRWLAAFETLAQARLRRCGKSAPRFWQQERQGKPRRKQDQIGVSYGEFSHRDAGRLLEVYGNVNPR